MHDMKAYIGDDERMSNNSKRNHYRIVCHCEVEQSKTNKNRKENKKA